MKFIPGEGSFAEWRKDPGYVAAYDALEEEFALASEVIAAAPAPASARPNSRHA